MSRSLRFGRLIYVINEPRSGHVLLVNSNRDTIYLETNSMTFDLSDLESSVSS